MRAKRWASLAVAAGTIAGVGALPVMTAQAATTAYTVHVGGDSVVSGVGFEGMRFLAPPTFTVHKGDTINFTFDGFHTATVLPDDQTATEWRTENQSGITGPTAGYSPLVPDADDGGTQFELNPAVAFPSDPSCGTSAAPCAYDGKSVVNSGLPLASNSFNVTINDNPGAVIWVVCLLHADMNMRFQVVPDSATATTPAEVDQYASQTLASDRDEARALLPKLETPTKHKSNGTVVWDAYAGFDQDGWSLDAMLPHTLHVKKGQTVRWHFSQLMGNLHTVTFPKKSAVSLNGQFPVPACEGTSGDTPPTSPNPPFCADPTALELHIPGAAVLPAGTHHYHGAGLHSSGVEGGLAPSRAPYDLRFTKRSGKKGYTYACIVHGAMMDGTVIVG